MCCLCHFVVEKGWQYLEGCFYTSEFVMGQTCFHSFCQVFSTWSFQSGQHFRYAKRLDSSSALTSFWEYPFLVSVFLAFDLSSMRISYYQTFCTNSNKLESGSLLIGSLRLETKPDRRIQTLGFRLRVIKIEHHVTSKAITWCTDEIASKVKHCSN